jgi:hypothetical protein
MWILAVLEPFSPLSSLVHSFPFHLSVLPLFVFFRSSSLSLSHHNSHVQTHFPSGLTVTVSLSDPKRL